MEHDDCEHPQFRRQRGNIDSTRIEFPNYPSCERLRTMSMDELMSSFCKGPTAWGERLFTPCRPFAKGPRFMNMVMTFVLHPLLL